MSDAGGALLSKALCKNLSPWTARHVVNPAANIRVLQGCHNSSLQYPHLQPSKIRSYEVPKNKSQHLTMGTSSSPIPKPRDSTKINAPLPTCLPRSHSSQDKMALGTHRTIAKDTAKHCAALQLGVAVTSSKQGSPQTPNTTALLSM